MADDSWGGLADLFADDAYASVYRQLSRIFHLVGRKQTS